MHCTAVMHLNLLSHSWLCGQGKRGSVLLERVEPRAGDAAPSAAVLADELDALWPQLVDACALPSPSGGPACTAANGTPITCDALTPPVSSPVRGSTRARIILRAKQA